MFKLAAAAALAAAFVASPALAAGAESAAARINVTNLNPHDPADAQRLDRRARTPAFTACGGHEGSVRTLKQVVKRSDCYAETLAEARAKVGVTQLAAR